MALLTMFNWLLRKFSSLLTKSNTRLRIHPNLFKPFVKRKLRKRGIKIGGRRPCDIQVHDSRFFSKVALDPVIGLEEGFVEGWWAPNHFPTFFNKLITEWSQHGNSGGKKFTYFMDIPGWRFENNDQMVPHVVEKTKWDTMAFEESESITVEAWIKNFQKNKLQKQFGENFGRMRQFYLQGVDAVVRLRKFQQWEQVVPKEDIIELRYYGTGDL